MARDVIAAWIGDNLKAIVMVVGGVLGAYQGINHAIEQGRLEAEKIRFEWKTETEVLKSQVAAIEQRMNEVRKITTDRYEVFCKELRETREVQISMQGDMKLLLSRVDDLRGAKRVMVSQ